MTDEEKLEFYKSEYGGAPFCDFIGFRSTKALSRFLNTKAMMEGRDISQIITTRWSYKILTNFENLRSFDL